MENAELCRRISLDSEAVERRTGIRARRWAGEQESPSVLAERAARAALESAGLRSSQLDAILVSTTSPDTVLPSTACHLQRLLGAPGVAAFDLAASCSGFLYGLAMADSLIRSGQMRRCLVVATEVKSRFLDLGDETTAILFGDGAGAAILAEGAPANSEESGLLGIRLYADGSRYGLISMPAGGSRLPASAQTIQERRHAMRVQGGPLFRVAVRRLAAAVQDLLKEFGLGVDDLRKAVFHQANARLLAALRERLEMPAERVHSVIDRYGNASSASLPIALDDAARTGAIRPGDLVLLGAFGGGLTWATGLIRW